MPDPALDHSISELAALAKSFNDRIQAINDELERNEAALVATNAGITLFLGEPLYVRAPQGSTTGTGAQFGFGKWGDNWGLWIRRGTFQREPTGDWRMFGTADTMLPVLAASREERAAAVELLPSLIEAMKRRIEAELDSIDEAKSRAAKKAGR